MARDNRLGLYLEPRISKSKQEQGKMPVITTLDIETSYAHATLFRTGEQRINIHQITSPSRLIMVGWKDYNKKSAEVFSEDELGYTGMLKATWDLLDSTDILITFNGNSFDIPWIMGAFMEAGFTPPSPFISVDLYRVSRRGRYMSHKLDYLCQLFGIGQKINHAGEDLWGGIDRNDPVAWKKMKKYCKMDVVITENLLDYMGPWIKNFPNLSQWTGEHGCYRCGSKNLNEAGWHRTNVTAYARLQCKDCGAWNRLTHNKNRLTTRSI